jgi:hypothetical protein
MQLILAFSNECEALLFVGLASPVASPRLEPARTGDLFSRNLLNTLILTTSVVSSNGIVIVGD